MNKDTLKGDWKILKGKVKENWGKLTDDDITFINGKREQLLGKIQQRYGYAKEKAEHELAEWEKKHEDLHAHHITKDEFHHTKFSK